uniref:Uncharacterized protein n=1 Tax=Nelumbo nucifera TaxID=4432 RepID=A0A822XIN2_NELNU|nr:TPA_asm: hypothetical protein HUJ06_021713 [Nelumbo nucifera]
MAGIALLLDLWRKNIAVSSHTLHSSGLFSATFAASTAAASVAAARPFASRFLFGGGRISVSFCDANTEWTEDHISNLQSASRNIFQHDSIKYNTKEYPIEQKPLFSDFGLRSLAMTSLRSFLVFYLPLLEPHSENEDDDDFLLDNPEENHVDLVTPFKKSIKQILRKTTVITTRRVLERLAVCYVSQRMAWKLLKDVPKSAKRKAEGECPLLFTFTESVGQPSEDPC